MWRFVLVALSILLLALPAAADEATDGFQCITCEQDCAAYGVEPGERICTAGGDNPTDTDNPTADSNPNDDAAEPTQAVAEPASFSTGLVEWEFIPVIEATSATGAVSAVDVQRTIQQDEEAIANCFEAQSYPGDGIVDVEVYLAYNGIPQAVNGNTDGVSPNQARCILRRAWHYEFPRIAENADQPSRLTYRVQFAPQRRGVPDTDPARAQLLLERVSTPQEKLRTPIAAGLFTQLLSAERCAAMTVEELPTDMVVTEVDMTWRRSGERYIPADVDITVVNQTGTDLPSPDVLECFTQTLTVWDLELDDTDLARVESNFFITIRPAGWYGS